MQKYKYKFFDRYGECLFTCEAQTLNEAISLFDKTATVEYDFPFVAIIKWGTNVFAVKWELK